MRRALLCIALLSVTPTAQVQSPSGSDTGRIETIRDLEIVVGQ